MAEVKYKDKQGNEFTFKALSKGKTPDQIAALKFLFGLPIKEGCFKKEFLSPDGYMDLVRRKGTGAALKDRALSKLGIDLDQVKEIEPVCFEGFRYEYKNLQPYVAHNSDRYFSSMFEVTWLFFGNDQVYVFNHSFDTTDETVQDTTQEYFYKDITAFATKSDSWQKKVWIEKGKGCSKTSELTEKQINEDLFRIVVPGDAFSCAYKADESASSKIAAMKQKLRDKKQ
jgi:hypothetical protein